MCKINSSAGVAQLVRARGSYPRCPGFKSLHRHHFSGCVGCGSCGGCIRCAAALCRTLLFARRTHCTYRTRCTMSMSILTPPGARSAVTDCFRQEAVWLSRCRAAPIRWRCCSRLREIAGVEGFHVAGAAHLNHQLRGADADADERVLPRPCRHASSIPIHVERVDVAQLARRRVFRSNTRRMTRGTSFSSALPRVSMRRPSPWRTRKNDQAETFLLRLLRGAGPRGLSGMHPRSGIVVRPFIDTPRSDVRAFSAQRGRSRSAKTPRTPIRRFRAIAFVTSCFRFSRRASRPGIVDVLDREAAIAREDAEYLDAAAARGRRAPDRTHASGVEISSRGAPFASRRRSRGESFGWRSRWRRADRFVGFDAVDAVLALRGV